MFSFRYVRNPPPQLKDQGKDFAGIDPQISDILDKFPPVCLDDVEISPPTGPNIKCRNCDFKFRTM